MTGAPVVCVRCGAGGRDGARATLAVRSAGALVAQLHVTYEADVTGDVAQIYARQLDAACSALLGRHASRGSVVTAAQLDTLLTGAVFDDVASSTPPQHSLPPRAFELLFDSAKYAASGNVLLSFATIRCVQIKTYIFSFSITQPAASNRVLIISNQEPILVVFLCTEFSRNFT